MVAARERIAQLVGALSAPVVGVELTVEAGALRLDVDGIGRIGWPVSAQAAGQLIAAAAPARYGKGEQTLTDTRVRDTWEVPTGLVHLRWTEEFTDALEVVKEEFGLPSSGVLWAQFHSLLVYEEGQFFLPHQDSEKQEGMIATLVIVLPSDHTGGELVIHHESGTLTHRGRRRGLSLIAFHADRRHEVRPVTSGQRVAVTYNLLWDGPAAAPAGEATTADLARSLTEHFTTPTVPRSGGRAGDPPSRLVYLLDHEYTEQGLGWSHLKGVDAARVASLRAAARAADCEVLLALTEISQTWDVLDDAGGNGWWDDEDEDGRPVEVDRAYELGELIDDSTKLTYWVEDDGSSHHLTLSVADGEVCAATATSELTPQTSQYEGYMGNYGNTLDRWYRRAALVVWPRQQGFANRAEAAPGWAVDQLTSMAAAGDVEGARRAADTLLQVWQTVALPADVGAVLLSVLGAARLLGDPRLARALASRFAVGDLRTDHVRALGKLASEYGASWVADLLRDWTDRRPPPAWGDLTTRTVWLTGLPEFTATLAAVGEPGEVTAGHLVALGWDTLGASLRTASALPAASRREKDLAALGAPLTALVVAAGSLEQARTEATLGDVLAFVAADPEVLLPCLLPGLRSAVSLSLTATARRTFTALAGLCAAAVSARLERPARADGDWSLAATAGCSCDLCARLGMFLSDSREQTLEWPLAEQRRRHVHARIDDDELPVSHQTRRSGRPYTLVLTKDAGLFAREALARQRDHAALDWLARTWGAPL